jgi:NAD(P)-dependent dehydrogenase (short-subunit alcohol dehydrogenase family)
MITSSVTGLRGFEGVSAYVAAKHAQVGLMRTAAKELAPRRIRVNTLHPGPTSTPFQDDIEMRATGRSRQEAAAIFDSLIPLGRHTTPRRDRPRRALPRLRRHRAHDGAHLRDRRRPERLSCEMIDSTTHAPVRHPPTAGLLRRRPSVPAAPTVRRHPGTSAAESTI